MDVSTIIIINIIDHMTASDILLSLLFVATTVLI